MAPPANNLIMSGTSIQSFRHFEHQNPSIISESKARARMVQQFQRSRRRRSTVVLDDGKTLKSTVTNCMGDKLEFVCMFGGRKMARNSDLGNKNQEN